MFEDLAINRPRKILKHQLKQSKKQQCILIKQLSKKKLKLNDLIMWFIQLFVIHTERPIPFDAFNYFHRFNEAKHVCWPFINGSVLR